MRKDKFIPLLVACAGSFFFFCVLGLVISHYSLTETPFFMGVMCFTLLVYAILQHFILKIWWEKEDFNAWLWVAVGGAIIPCLTIILLSTATLFSPFRIISGIAIFLIVFGLVFLWIVWGIGALAALIYIFQQWRSSAPFIHQTLRLLVLYSISVSTSIGALHLALGSTGDYVTVRNDYSEQVEVTIHTPKSYVFNNQGRTFALGTLAPGQTNMYRLAFTGCDGNITYEVHGKTMSRSGGLIYDFCDAMIDFFGDQLQIHVTSEGEVLIGPTSYAFAYSRLVAQRVTAIPRTAPAN